MTGALFLALLLGAVALAEAVYYFVRYLGERPAEELRRRLQTVGAPGAGVRILRQRRLASSAWASDLLLAFPFAERLEKLLDQTDSESTVAGLLARSVGLAALGFLAGLVLRRPIPGVALAGVLGIMPLLLALRARGARTTKIAEQLPDTIDMMARALRAGHGVAASFKLVAQECAPPVAVEFGKAYEQQNLGLSLDAAMQNMTQRVPGCLDLKLLAISVKIQGETGGNLVEILEKMADTMRERFKFYSKLRAITAEGRVSAIILGSLPFFVALLIALTNPSYLAELGHGVGRMILAGGAGLWLVGMVWIRKLAQVEY